MVSLSQDNDFIMAYDDGMKSQPPEQQQAVIQIRDGQTTKVIDHLCVEEPLVIAVREASGEAQPLLTIMRTPGADKQLAMGFLFAEGLIQFSSDIQAMTYTGLDETEDQNSLEVVLQRLPNDLPKRLFASNSSCGLCGRQVIDDLEKRLPDYMSKEDLSISPEIFATIFKTIREQQQLFNVTSGSHAAWLYDLDGNCQAVAEDIGRHNAVDKLIGEQLIAGTMPVVDSVLVVSGRASYDLVQKAVMAGIQCVLAVGAPSSLALRIAQRFELTLVGFLRANSYTVYSGQWRIKSEQ